MKEVFLKQLTQLCIDNNVDTVVVGTTRKQVDELKRDMTINHKRFIGDGIPELPEHLSIWQYAGVFVTFHISEQ
jgi:hypothetical protein